MSDKKRQPRSDFGKSVGEEVAVFLKDADELSSLDLPLDSGVLRGRLVGVDRPGVWLEPKAWYDDSIKKGEAVSHLFLKWDNVLAIKRDIDNEEFGDKKQYRGLRPRD